MRPHSLISPTFSKPSRRRRRRRLIHSDRPPSDLTLSYLPHSQSLAAAVAVAASSTQTVLPQTSLSHISLSQTLAAATSSTQTLAASLTISPSPHQLRSGIASLRDW
uniref:Uncharacterized protein n=1 Tax=Fagus sylvatica TaxID=28930 RepID=A0A2N9IVR5_FAGSY